MLLTLGALGLGLAMLGLAAWQYRREQAFAARASTAPATVIALRDEPLRIGDSADRPFSRAAAPVFRYTDAAGQVQEAASATYADPPAWRIGQQLVICYDPAQPQQAEPASFLGLHMLSLIFAATGAVFTIGALSAMV